ncbi:unnamed protein product [Chrysoparadoxa australica]
MAKMGVNRKLQTEIDRTLKKVDEGVAEFDSIWDKVYSATQQNQKEKYEGDLKKEIKKLQRHRDQVKSWIAGNEIKDKKDLLNVRKLIESKMEQFKVCEKETKTKAFSKEGLARAAMVDPQDKAKTEQRDWLQEKIDELNTQIDGFEADIEKLSSQSGKRRKKEDAARITQLEQGGTVHKYHISRLEQIMRMMDNDELEVEQVDEIKEDLEFYIETSQDVDTIEPFGDDNYDFYEVLELDALNSVGGAVSAAVPSSKKEKDKDKQDDDEEERGSKSKSKSKRSSASSSSIPMTIGRPVVKGKGDKEKPPTSLKRTASAGSAGMPIIGRPVAQPPQLQPQAPPTVSIAPTPPGRKASSPGSSAPSQAPEQQPQSMAVRIQQQQQEQQQQPPASSSQSPRLNSSQPLANASGAARHQMSLQSPPLSQQRSQQPPSPHLSQQEQQAAAGSAAAGGIVGPSTEQGENSGISGVQQDKSQPGSSAEEGNDNGEGQSGTSQQDTLTQGQQRLSPTLSQGLSKQDGASGSRAMHTSQSPGRERNPMDSLPGIQAFSMASTSSAPSPGRASQAPISQTSQPTTRSASPSDSGRGTQDDATLSLLDNSFAFIPTRHDGDRTKVYTPRNPYRVPASYPTTPSTVFEDPRIFEKLGMDTLFFIFYYQQGTYQQHLAARELKRQSWRYHKKYMTWFQRHEEPKVTTDDYEQGTYVYFDYETGWCQRIKGDFTFEYIFLGELV